MKELLVDFIESPIGTIIIVADAGKLLALDFADYEERLMKLLKRRYAALELKPTVDPFGFSTRVEKYLAGDCASLTTIPVNPGGTAFQQQVWQALRDIPSGQTLTYSQLAARIGRPKATRAVGMTNSLNPIAIVLPCHRVVGANHSLTGYAGGLERKRWLLRHEGALL
ncbi:MAG: methylated-DNA--[protein]-cysteine S-methyltransferase [Acidobacteria bacterium]|nr:methylated-DNA--[protein]-cysteine S-methyltransferase [Acidobacteriota bacterium]